MSETERRGKTITPPRPSQRPKPQGGKTITPPPPKPAPRQTPIKRK